MTLLYYIPYKILRLAQCREGVEVTMYSYVTTEGRTVYMEFDSDAQFYDWMGKNYLRCWDSPPVFGNDEITMVNPAGYIMGYCSVVTGAIIVPALYNGESWG